MNGIRLSDKNFCGLSYYTILKGAILLCALAALTSAGIGIGGLTLPASSIGGALKTLGSLTFLSAGLFVFAVSIVGFCCRFRKKDLEESVPKDKSAPSNPSPTPENPIDFAAINLRQAAVIPLINADSVIKKKTVSFVPEDGAYKTDSFIEHTSGSYFGENEIVSQENDEIQIRNSRSSLKSSRESSVGEFLSEVRLFSDDEIRIEDRAAAQKYLEDECLPKFMKAILEAGLAQKKSKKVDLTLTKEAKKLLRKEVKRAFMPRLTDSAQQERFSSGEHCVFTVKGIEGKIFKINREYPLNKELAAHYVRLRENAKKDPYLTLYVPHCEYIYCAGKWVIVEEFISGICDDIDFQKGFFRWGITHAEKGIQDHFKKALFELALFICRNKFGDCKYNNTLWNNDAELVLPDLDDHSAVQGLVASYILKQNQGLFSYLKSEWVGDFLDFVRAHLANEKEYKEVEAKAEVIKSRLVKKEKRREAHLKFLKEHHIESPVEPVRLPDLNFPDEKLKPYTYFLLNMINSGLSFNADLVTGRTLMMPIGDLIFSFLAKVEGIADITEENCEIFLSPALYFLKAQDLIFDFKIKPRATFDHLPKTDPHRELPPLLVLYY